jgi:uncharacterized membrane protein YqiK
MPPNEETTPSIQQVDIWHRILEKLSYLNGEGRTQASLSLKDPKDATKNLLDLINTQQSSRDQHTKISNFSVHQNEQAEKDIRKTIPFITVSKHM